MYLIPLITCLVTLVWSLQKIEGKGKTVVTNKTNETPQKEHTFQENNYLKFVYIYIYTFHILVINKYHKNT